MLKSNTYFFGIAWSYSLRSSECGAIRKVLCASIPNHSSKDLLCCFLAESSIYSLPPYQNTRVTLAIDNHFGLSTTYYSTLYGYLHEASLFCLYFLMAANRLFDSILHLLIHIVSFVQVYIILSFCAAFILHASPIKKREYTLFCIPNVF